MPRTRPAPSRPRTAPVARGAADARDRAGSVQARIVAVVIAATMVLWMGAQWAGGRFDLPPRYALLIDLMALAGFAWALIVTYGLWRRRRGG
jgi:hypothetical protein